MFLSLALALAILVPSLFTYAAGADAGRLQGEVASHLISVAMKAGPTAAIAWGQLMQDNNGTSALAVCRTTLQQDAGGRHYCPMDRPGISGCALTARSMPPGLPIQKELFDKETPAVYGGNGP